MNRERKKKGFTLAELLIVVAIIAVLVAVAIPVFTGAIEKSRAAVCMANRRSAQGIVATAVMLNPELKDELKAGDSWETVSRALEKYEYSFIDEICPVDGEITLGAGWSLNCSIHDGSESGGGSTPVLMPQLDKALEALKQTTSAFKPPKNHVGEDNQYKNEFLALVGDDIPAMTGKDLLEKFPDGAKIQGVNDQTTINWVGMRTFFDGEAQDLLVALEAGRVKTETNGLTGLLFYYNGHYYRSNQTNYSGKYDYISFNVNFSYGTTHTFAEYLSDRGWVLAE